MGHHPGKTVEHARFSQKPTIFLLNLSEIGLVLVKKILVGHHPGKTVEHERFSRKPTIFLWNLSESGSLNHSRF